MQTLLQKFIQLFTHLQYLDFICQIQFSLAKKMINKVRNHPWSIQFFLQFYQLRNHMILSLESNLVFYSLILCIFNIVIKCLVIEEKEFQRLLDINFLLR